MVKKPHLTKNGSGILCKTEHIVLVVVQGLATGSSSSSASSSSTSLPQDSSSASPSPARLRSDDTHAEASGGGGDPPKIKKNQKKGNIQATRRRLRDLPEWLEEFTDDLEDT